MEKKYFGSLSLLIRWIIPYMAAVSDFKYLFERSPAEGSKCAKVSILRRMASEFQQQFLFVSCIKEEATSYQKSVDPTISYSVFKNIR